MLATGGDDKLIKYWNVADGKELRKSQGHGDSVYSRRLPPRRHQARLRVGRQDDPDLERRRRQGAAQARRPSRRHLRRRLQPRRQAGWPRSATAATSSSGTSPRPSRCSTSTSRPVHDDLRAGLEPRRLRSSPWPRRTTRRICSSCREAGIRTWHLAPRHRDRSRLGRPSGTISPQGRRMPTGPSNRQAPSSKTNWYTGPIRLVGQIQTFGPSRQALKFLLRLRGMPTSPSSGGDVELVGLEIARASRAIVPSSSRSAPVEVGPIGDREQLGAGPHRPAHRLRRDDLERQAAEQDQHDGTADDQAMRVRGHRCRR